MCLLLYRGESMNFEEAKEKAVKFLVLQLRTEQEVINKLKKLQVDEDIIYEVTTYLKKIKYIDDGAYVDAYLRQSVSIPKYSLYEIRMKLIQKGISKSLVSEKLEEFDGKTYESKLVDKLMKGKLKNMEPIKQKAYLYRRGFKISNAIEE